MRASCHAGAWIPTVSKTIYEATSERQQNPSRQRVRFQCQAGGRAGAPAYLGYRREASQLPREVGKPRQVATEQGREVAQAEVWVQGG
jgi:hypothetical protein